MLFVSGNFVYSPVLGLPWYISSILSEFIFVLMYTLIDYSNIKYKYKFLLPHILLLIIFYFPIFLPLFYSNTVQYFSVSIAILAIVVNARILYFLYNKNIKKIFCSRISTLLASVVEILLFSFILHIGFMGALLMSIMRPIYILIISTIIFKNN